MTNEVDPVRLTKIYLKMRDKKAEITAAAEAEVTRIEEQMKIVEGQLLALLGNNTNMANEFGTVTKTIKEKFWCSEWDKFNEFVLEHADKGTLSLFEHRLAQNNMKKFLQDHPGIVPPGLQADRRFGVVVRRKTAKP